MNYTEDRRTETDAAADLARMVGHGVTVVPGEMRVAFGSDNKFAVSDLESLGARPRRPRGSVNLFDVESFVRYIGGVAGFDDVDRVYLDPKGQRVTAIIGDDEPGSGSWRDWRVNLALQPTESWQRWLKYNGEYLPQATFAEHVKDSIADFVDPSGAHMFDVAESIDVARTGEFKSAKRLHSGEYGFTWTETHEARAGERGELEVPRQFGLSLRLWHNSDPVSVDAELRYRIHDGALALAYRIADVQGVIEAAFTDIIATLRDSGLDVYLGVAPEPTR